MISAARRFVILDPILHLRGSCCTEFRLFKFVAYCFVNHTAENIAFEETEVDNTLTVKPGSCYFVHDCVHVRACNGGTYRVSQEEWTKLRESVPYVELYRYNPKHLYPKLNGYGDNGHRKVWASGVSTYCTPSVTPYSSTAHARQRDTTR